MKELNGCLAATAVVILTLLCRITSCADPPPKIQGKVTLCLYCNERTAKFAWTYTIQSIYRIQWKFGDIFMSNYTQPGVHLTQESLSINQTYRGRFNLLKPGDVGFSLTNVTREDLGTYRCIVTLGSGTGITLQGVLEERRTDKQGKVEVCSEGAASFNWTRTLAEPILHIQWRFNGTSIANTTKLSRGSLHITAKYEPRFHLLRADGVGFQLEKVTAADAGTYACVMTLQNGLYNITRDLEVKELQSGDLDIAVINQESQLSCGDEKNSSFTWVFLNVSGMGKVYDIGHVLQLTRLPTTGSVYCIRQSDCTVSSIYNFTTDNVPEEVGSQISLAAYLVPIVIIIVIIVIIVLVVLYKRRGRPRDTISGEVADSML